MLPIVSLRRFAALVTLAVFALASLPAGAQTAGPESVPDIARAFMWTGHLEATAKGDPVEVVRQALQNWQASKHHPATDTLPPEQLPELLADAEKQRRDVGWSTLIDKSVGISIGVPTKLVKFVGAHTSEDGLAYDFEGAIGYNLHIRYGDPVCRNVTVGLARFPQNKAHPITKIRFQDGYGLWGETDTSIVFVRGVCHAGGSVIVGINVLKSLASSQRILLTTVPNSIRIDRTFNPTATPQPKLALPAPTSEGVAPITVASQSSDEKRPPGADKDGTTGAIQREARIGPDLTVEQIFEKVSPAVFVVFAGPRMGSAVAIGEHELLTNCHVVQDLAHVTLRRDKTEQKVDVISANDKADRCILRTPEKLASWVPVRPYMDIKVGERAVTVGTPSGLELTVAEGVVSSKREMNGRRLVQTTAPISPGSSGGGLFDMQGHLLGITTFHLINGQNLNFAVAAEDFVRADKSDPGKQAAAAP